MKTKKKKSAVCYGEFLWDVLPSKVKPGGAPVNVAYHLKNFGIHSFLISKVGKDNNGDMLLALLKKWDISTSTCDVDFNYKTGIAEAKEDENHNMQYTIHEPVAWDYIFLDHEYIPMVYESDIFVFGSLAARNLASRETLFKLLEVANYKVFDINLRAPFYSTEVISHLLHACNLLKINKEELDAISGWFCKSLSNQKDCIHEILSRFEIDEIIVTNGSKGAMYYTEEIAYHCPAPVVQVKDTVGSGDSFLAAFLAQKAHGENIENCMQFATALGGFVATQEGACPAYRLEQLDRFMKDAHLLENSAFN